MGSIDKFFAIVNPGTYTIYNLCESAIQRILLLKEKSIMSTASITRLFYVECLLPPKELNLGIGLVALLFSFLVSGGEAWH